MRRTQIVLLFLTFVAAFVSKWFLDIGFWGMRIRIGYYAPLLFALVVLAVIQIGRQGLKVPRPLVTLIVWKGLLLFAAALTLPAVITESRLGVGVVSKAMVYETVNAAGIAAVLLLASRWSPRERSQVVRLYLVAVGIAALYTAAQAVAYYGAGGLDLDEIVTQYLPFWSRDTPSINEDVWGAFNIRFYRFTGLTGDPNVNATMFLLALPIMYVVMEERFDIRIAALLAASLAIIGQSLSNSVIALAPAVLLALTWMHRRRAKGTVAFVLVLVVGLIAYVWQTQREILLSALTWKLNPTGTFGDHMRISREAIELWLEHPLGLGPNAFAVYSDDLNAHNTFLQVLVEYGPVGLIAVIGGTVSLLLACVRSRTTLGTGVALSLLALSASAFGHNVFTRIEFQLPLYTLGAIAIMEGRDLALARARQRFTPAAARPPIGAVPATAPTLLPPRPHPVS